MRITLLALALLTTLGAPARAQEDVAAKAAACSSIADSLQRLTCFDKAFPAGIAAPAVAPAAEGPPTTVEAPVPTAASVWEVEATKSAIDDSPSITALLMPTDTSSTGVGDGGLAIILRCVENTTSVVLSTTMFMVEENVSVTIRIDDKPAQTSSWGRSTNYKAVGLWNGSKAIPFVRELATASKLVVRVQESDRVDGEFELGNVGAVAQQVADACNWDMEG